jgi:hypothetical protein
MQYSREFKNASNDCMFHWLDAVQLTVKGIEIQAELNRCDSIGVIVLFVKTEKMKSEENLPDCCTTVINVNATQIQSRGGLEDRSCQLGYGSLRCTIRLNRMDLLLV